MIFDLVSALEWPTRLRHVSAVLHNSSVRDFHRNRQTKRCVEHMKAWMDFNKIKLNVTKLKYWFLVLAPEQVSLAMSIPRLVGI